MNGGERRRDFRDFGKDIEEVAFETWPINGPRTMLWVLLFLLRRGVAPTDHHRWWLSTYRLTASDWGTSEHYSCDQLDLPDIPAAEALTRRIQAIEWQYRERVRETLRTSIDSSVSIAGAAALTSSEVDLLEGTLKVNATLMVCPELIKYVVEESKSEADVSKASWKAREERLFAHTGILADYVLQRATQTGAGTHVPDGGEGGHKQGQRSRGKRS